MRLPVIQGVIERRLLVNYRVAPERLRAVLPAPFEPVVVNGWGLAGLCLIRLGEIRPRWLPAVVGLRTENVAHRIAGRWPAPDGTVREGVYVLRRDSASRLNAMAGGRVFPGVHHHARIDVEERGDEIAIAVWSDDGATRIAVRARAGDAWPADSVFGSIEEASRFFAGGSVGYSSARAPGRFEGLELRTERWAVEPVEIVSVASSFFDDRARFPEGTIALDGALLMRGIPHTWHARDAIAAQA